MTTKLPWYGCRADSRLAPSQWETALQSNAISHWLGTNLESVLIASSIMPLHCIGPWEMSLWHWPLLCCAIFEKHINIFAFQSFLGIKNLLWKTSIHVFCIACIMAVYVLLPNGLTLFQAWINDHMPSKVWGEITYPFFSKTSMAAILMFGNG